MNYLRLQALAEGARECMNGTLLFRDAAISKEDQQRVPKGKKLMLVAGLVMVADNARLEGETLVQVKGLDSLDGMVIFPNLEAQRLDKKYVGWALEDLMSEPIWKVRG